MPTYYFHLFNSETIWDTEGVVLPNDAVAVQKAAVAAREMAAESVREGRLVLDHRIVVCAENNKSVGTVHFRDVVQVEDSTTTADQA